MFSFPIQLYMTNWHAAHLRDIWDLQSMDGLDKLPDDEYSKIVLLGQIIYNVDTGDNAFGMNGMLQTIYPNASQIIADLYKDGYLRLPDNAEKLSTMSVSELKAICNTYGITKKGKRTELLNNIVNSSYINEIVKDIKDISIIPTEKGLRWIKSLYEERFQIERNTFYYLIKGQISVAIKEKLSYEAKRLANMPELKNEILLKAMNPEKTHYYQEIVDILDTDSLQSVYLAYQRLWDGDSQLNFDEICTSFSKDDEEIESILFQSAIRKATRELQQLSELFDRGEIHCIYDANTCRECAKKSGKIVALKNAKVGIDIPPFHPYCRCMLAPVFSFGNDTTSFARNPLTDESTKTNAKNFLEWENSLSEEERNALNQKQPHDYRDIKNRMKNTK